MPFVAQTALYLGGGGAEQPVNVPVDSYVELRTGDGKGAAAEVLDPDGKRVLSLEEAVKARNFALDREGFFEIKTAAGRRSLVAAHADRRESDLAPIPPETLDLWKGTGSRRFHARRRMAPARPMRPTNRGVCGPIFYCYC